MYPRMTVRAGCGYYVGDGAERTKRSGQAGRGSRQICSLISQNGVLWSARMVGADVIENKEFCCERPPVCRAPPVRDLVLCDLYFVGKLHPRFLKTGRRAFLVVIGCWHSGRWQTSWYFPFLTRTVNFSNLRSVSTIVSATAARGGPVFDGMMLETGAPICGRICSSVFGPVGIINRTVVKPERTQ